MIIWNSLQLFAYIHGYLFIFANTEIYKIKYKTHLKNSRRHLINSSDVFVIKGFTVIKQLSISTLISSKLLNSMDSQKQLKRSCQLTAYL